MIPQIKAKFRKRGGVHYAVERLTGVQYRCRLCNTVFYNEQKFENHLKTEIRTLSKRNVNKKCPKLHETVTAFVYYAEDVLNALKAVNVKQFRGGELYDGSIRNRDKY